MDPRQLCLFNVAQARWGGLLKAHLQDSKLFDETQLNALSRRCYLLGMSKKISNQTK